MSNLKAVLSVVCTRARVARITRLIVRGVHNRRLRFIVDEPLTIIETKVQRRVSVLFSHCGSFHLKSFIRTTSAISLPRAITNPFPLGSHLKLKMRSFLNWVSCFIGPPSIG